jgi:Na+/pantothenate symporter
MYIAFSFMISIAAQFVGGGRMAVTVDTLGLEGKGCLIFRFWVALPKIRNL